MTSLSMLTTPSVLFLYNLEPRNVTTSFAATERSELHAGNSPKHSVVQNKLSLTLQDSSMITCDDKAWMWTNDWSEPTYDCSMKARISVWRVFGFERTELGCAAEGSATLFAA